MSWIAAIIKDNNGEKGFYQFDSEEELRYFLSVHEDYELVKAERSIENG